jgi:hypothetical protein
MTSFFKAACLVVVGVAASSLILHAGQSSSAPVRPAAPLGNLNQVMRGVLFPNANVIFNVQNEDPAVEKKPAALPDPAAGFSLTAWGDGLYPRWEVVKYAAVALEESASLLTNAERVCQNGRPVPTTQADWTRYSTELADTAKAVYAASQAKNRDAVIELTDRLNEACANCHNAYRRGPDADRCLPKR